MSHHRKVDISSTHTHTTEGSRHLKRSTPSAAPYANCRLRKTPIHRFRHPLNHSSGAVYISTRTRTNLNMITGEHAKQTKNVRRFSLSTPPILSVGPIEQSTILSETGREAREREIERTISLCAHPSALEPATPPHIIFVSNRSCATVLCTMDPQSRATVRLQHLQSQLMPSSSSSGLQTEVCATFVVCLCLCLLSAMILSDESVVLLGNERCT